MRFPTARKSRRVGRKIKYQAILWDNDGPLIDSERVFFEASVEHFAQHGVTLSKHDWGIHYLGEGLGSQKLATMLGMDPAVINGMCAARDQAYRDALLQSPALRPQVIETLTQLSGQVKMAMVTGNHIGSVRRMHEGSGVLERFDAIITADDYYELKPHPEPFLTGAQALGIAPEHCLAVEDSKRGLWSAINAGMDCIVVPSDLTEMQDFTGALAVEQDVSGVLQHLGR